MLSGHLSSVLADGGFPAASPLPPLTDLRGSLLDTLSPTFTRLNPFTSSVHLPVCVCVCVKKEKSVLSGVLGCAAAFFCKMETIREVKSQGVIWVAYQNTSG